MAELDLHTRLRSAIEERLALAEAAQHSNERLTLSWPRTAGKDALAAFFNADPIAFTIRACRADLARLERHAAHHRECDVVLLGDASSPCPEVRSLAEVWEVDPSTP